MKPTAGNSGVERNSRPPNLASLLAIGGLLFLAILCVFGQTLRHEFINCDDQEYVYENPYVLSGVTAPGIQWALGATHAANWHPLTWFAHMLDGQLYGLWAGGHHLTSVLLHAANAILLFLVLWRMTGAVWSSAMVAALFAVHPLRAESVAWVAERKDVLSGLFFMATLAAYVGYARHAFSLGRYLAVVVLFALGLMAKPVLVTLPFVLLLLDYWPLGRFRWSPQRTGTGESAVRLIVEKIPLFVLTALSCVATAVAQRLAVITLDQVPISWRIGNALVAYVAYLRDFVWPTGLAAFYPYPNGTLPMGQIAGALVILAAISVAVVLGRRRYPYLLVGWLWYLGMLVPMIGLVQVSAQARADRYTYLPQIGLCIALTWGAVRILSTRPHRRWLGAVSAVLALSALLACAWRQTAYWQDSRTIWTRTIDCTSQNYSAHYSLGVTLHVSGAIDQAMAEYQKALAIRPDHAEAHGHLGIALQQRGRREEAIAEYRKALEIMPDYTDAHNNLGAALLETGKIDEAIPHFRQALSGNPYLAQAHSSLGQALADRGQIDEAVTHYQAALQIQPNAERAHYRLGLALRRQGRAAEAAVQFHQAIQLRPDRTDAINELAQLLASSPDASLRNGPVAVNLAHRAVQLSGGKEAALLGTLAAAFAETGRFADAVQTAQQALTLATNGGDAKLAELLGSQIKLYQAGSPYREPTGPNR
jgi:protein O-mannosyl-transferase